MAVSTELALDEELRRALPRNFLVNVIDGGFFMLGLSFGSSVTVLPLFVSQFTSSPFLIGLIPALQSMGWLLPQLFMAPVMERRRRKKPMLLLMTLNERWPHLGMAVLAFFATSLAAPTVLALFFLLHTIRTFGSGFTATPWQDMIGKIIPPGRRGMFYGTQFGLGGLIGAGGAILAGNILEDFPFSRNFALCFLLAACSVAIGLFFVAATREPEGPAPLTTRPQGRAYWARLPGIIRANRSYRNLILFRVFYLLGSMGVAFYTVYVVNHFGLDSAQAGQLTFVMMAAQTVTYPFVGWLGDRFGHRRTLEIAGAVGVLMGLVSWLAPSGGWFVAVYFLLGVSSAAAMVGNLSAVYDFCAPEERPTYIGLTATVVGIPSAIIPIVGASIVSIFSYPTLFGLTALFCLVSWAIVRWGVRAPAREDAGLALSQE